MLGYRLNKDQKFTVDTLAKETGLNKNVVVQFLVELGMSTVLMSRKVSDRAKIDNALTGIDKKIQSNPKFLRLAQLLERAHDLGA